MSYFAYFARFFTHLTVILETALLLLKLDPSKSAAYEAGQQYDRAWKRNPCLEGTREEIQAALEQWFDDPDGAPVFWLNGMAGTGKSTIADTLYRIAERRQGPAGDFYCTRDSEDARNVSCIIPTLAYRLAFKLPAYCDKLVSFLSSTPCPSSGACEQQLVDLILKPLRKITLSRSQLFIIDALDECNTDPGNFIRLLLRHADEFRDVGIKFFVSSRPISEISEIFGMQDADGGHARRILHEEPLAEVQHDIRLVVTKELQDIKENCESYHKSFTYTEDNVNAIAVQAGPLFISAITACRFISSGARSGSAQQRLQQIVSTPVSTQGAIKHR